MCKSKLFIGVALIQAERERQIAVEGWTAKHDDTHFRGEMAFAAQCYAFVAGEQSKYSVMKPSGRGTAHWPWDSASWKPTENPIRNLVKAGALIAAEIDRLQRRQKPSKYPAKPA